MLRFQDSFLLHTTKIWEKNTKQNTLLKISPFLLHFHCRDCDLMVCIGKASPPLLFLPLQLLILEPMRLHALLKTTAALHPLWAPAIDLDPPILMCWKRKWLFKKAFVQDLESARTSRQNGHYFPVQQICQSAESVSQVLVLVSLKQTQTNKLEPE